MHTITQQHSTLTSNQMPRHNHAIYCTETNYLQGNQQKVLISETYRKYGNWLYQTAYYGGDKPQPFIGYEGNNQPHNHDNTSIETNVT